MAGFLERLNRKKYVTFDSSPLTRVLTLLDLTALGIGSTVGVGFYILAGEIARNTAGPAVTISFLIAAIASVFAGLCYAEFGARVPKSGSAYVYSYVCVGEFVAFIIGWNLILEYVIGTASVARGYSGYVDDLANNKISEAFNNSMHMELKALAEYPDFFALGLTLLLTVVLMIGVKESSRANNVFTGINIFVIGYVIIAGSTQADVDNWTLSEETVNNASFCTEPKEPNDEPGKSDWGEGGFSPYGFDGIMQGAAKCFFGFVGFDIIATTGEEAIRPERNIPLAISISLFFVFLAYFGMSTVLTLALPYCLEDPTAPLIELFRVKGMMVSMWIVSIGAIFGFSASLLGSMFPMPRIIYAMADDGLLFRGLSRINKKFKTPVLATALSGIVAGLMALLFSLEALVDMMSIGTLMAYTIVAVCVMILRYATESETDFANLNKDAATKINIPKPELIRHSAMDYVMQLINLKKLKEPTQLTSSLVYYATWCFFCLCFVLALFVTLFIDEASQGDGLSIALISIFLVLSLLNATIIALQPQSKVKLTFQVPFVPWIPVVSIFINLYLMCNLSTPTWIRFVVWMILGLLIYFLYGMKHSTGSEIKDMTEVSSNGIVNEGLGNDSDGGYLPPIIIQPPTPWDSKLGTPTSTLQRDSSRKMSVTDSSHVSNANKEASSLSFNNSEQVEKDLSQSQSIDVSPLTIENDDHSSSESESDDENGNEVNKLEATQIVVSATVYEDLHAQEIVPKEELTVKSRPEFHNLRKVSFEDINDQKLNSRHSDNLSDSDKHSPIISLDSDSKPDEESKEASESDFHLPLRATSSSPKAGRAEKPLTAVPSHILNNDTASSSVPVSPLAKERHPTKILVRASSFDNIPPSSLDSPLAKRVKQFVIIPVDMAKKEEDSEKESISFDQQITPSSSLVDTPLHPNTLPNPSEKSDLNMMSDLNTRLVELEEQNKQYEVSDAKGTPTDDKADNSTSGNSLLPSLDTIRERGESKIFTEGVNAVN